MSGFIRSRGNKENFKNEYFSGIPTLDDLIKTPLKTITCFFEDENSFLHNILLQVTVSEALQLDSNKTFVLSMEEKNKNFYEKNETIENAEEDLKIVIAWRYKPLTLKRKDFKYNLNAKHKLKEENLINSLEELLNKMKASENSTFIIFSLFSPLFDEINNEKMNEILYQIRKYTKTNNHRCFLSIPAFFHKINFLQYLDNAINLESIITYPGQNSYYHAIITLNKAFSLNSLNVNRLSTLKYGLIVKRSEIYIEKIDIPPEESSPSESGCGINF